MTKIASIQFPRLALVVFGCLIASVSATAANPPSVNRPHILYINADDLGVMDVGYNVSKFRTPNIDRLASQGMVFTNAYAPAANCAPSRACVHSGRWSARHGVFTVSNSDRGKSETRKLIPIKNRHHLPTEMITMAEVLKAGGYQTLHVGKYHIGADPLSEGFDVNVGGDTSGSPAGGYYSPWRNGSMKSYNDRVDAETHRVDVFTEETIKFMRQRHEQPMFVHFSPYLVHTPLTPVPEFLDHYKDGQLNAAYASMVEKLDAAIGRVLATLDELGIAESTLVVFSSDNGGIAAVHTQKPYRGGKGSYYEGGIREPMVMRWPGHIESASKCEEIVNTLDLFPTFLAASDLTSSTGVALDGQSLLPLMTGTGDWEPQPQYWHFPVYLQAYQGVKDDSRDVLFRTRPGSALRIKNWKLHEYFEDKTIELYDLSVDVGERNDLARKMPEKAADLHRQLIQWRTQTSAPVPKYPNPEYDVEVEQQMIRKVKNKSKRSNKS